MTHRGRIILELPPAPDNPRNSEGSFIRLKDGDILFVYSRYTGTRADDHQPADIFAMRSSDEGEHWSAPYALLNRKRDKAQNVMSVSLLRLGNGDLGLVYFLRYETADGRPFLRRSSDEGLTWGPPLSCANSQGVYVTNNDRVVRLTDGRILVPGAYHRTVITPQGAYYWDSKAVTYFFYSDDDGHTFRQSEPCYLQARRSASGLQEPGVIELLDGTLYAWARTDLGMQYEMYSHDRGEHWSTPQPSPFMSPLSPLSMKRLPDGRLMAIFNPIPNYPGRVINEGGWFGGRTPLVYALSADETETWSEPVVIEDDPDAGYCYTAIHFTADDHMLLAYSAGDRRDKSTLVRQRIRKLPLPGE